jgi:hypothetical protein
VGGPSSTEGPSGKSSVGIYDANYRIYGISPKAVKAGKKEAIANAPRLHGDR